METFRQLLMQLAEYETDCLIAFRYKTCSECQEVTQNEDSIICSICGCNILLKINDNDDCSLGKWKHE